MAGGSRDLRYSVTVDASDATGSLKKLSSDVKKTAKDIEGGFDDSASAGDKFKSTVDELSGKLESEFKSAAKAADKLGDALKQAGSNMDVGDAISDLKRMGFTFEEITADADKFAGSLKQLDDVKAAGVKELDAVAPGLATKLDDVNKSASSSKSVLANMVGNSAQDVASLGGVAGSAGVALGQMGEYIADAVGEGEKLGSALGSMAKVAGPMAGLAVAVQLVSTYMDGIKVEEAFRSGLVDEFTTSIRETGSAVSALNEKFTDTGKIQFTESGTGLLGLSKSVRDLTPIAAEYGVTVDSFIQNSQKGADAQKEFALSVTGATALYGDGKRSAAARSLIEALDQYGDTTKAAAKHVEDFNKVNVVTTQTAVDAFNAYTKLGDPVGQFPKEFERMADAMAHGMNPAAKDLEATTEGLGLSLGEVIGIAGDLAKTKLDEKMNAWNASTAKSADQIHAYGEELAKATARTEKFENAMSGADWGKAAVVGATKAMSAYTEEHFGLININADAQTAFDNLAKSVADNGKTFDVNTEKGRANQAALEDVARTLDTKLTAAYADAGGNLDAFKKSAGELADETLGRLQKELHLSDEQTAALGKSLGLTEGDYVARFELSGAAEAQVKLDLLNVSLDDFDDPNARKAYMDAVVQGDYVLALQIAKTMALGDKSVTYGVNVYTRYHTSGDRGSVGATPPEISGDPASAAPVRLAVNTKTAEKQIAALTRPRTARINVQAVPSSVLVRVNGGG